MHNNKIKIWLPIALSICMIIGMWIGYKLKDNIKSPQRFFDMQQANTLQEVVALLSKKYVDSLPIDSVQTRAINNVLHQLDPYSSYIPANNLQESNAAMAGSFEGIGIEFQIIRDTVNVLHVLAAGPAALAGVQIGDKLIQVNNKLITGYNVTPEKIKQQFYGDKGSMLHISLLRNTQPLTLDVKRDAIPAYTIDAAYKLDSLTGYIRINRFAESTYVEFMQALEKLLHNNIKQLVLDLRGNGGGLLSQAVDIADEFLADEKLVVYAQGATTPRKDYTCKRNGFFEKGKLVVLVNEATASAAEILAGALQDWDRATIIGNATFGKGLVQEQFTLSNGAALLLTVARYYLPTGRNIQKYYVTGYNTKPNDTAHRPIYKTPAGHVLYGAGGIIPSISIAADTMWNSAVAKQLIEKNIITKYAYEYFMANRASIIAHKSAIDFANKYSLPAATWSNFVGYVVQNKIEVSAISTALQVEILHRIKALLARHVWGNEGFYEVYNMLDPALLKAIYTIKN